MQVTKRYFSAYSPYARKTIAEVIRLSKIPPTAALRKIFIENPEPDDVFFWAQQNIRKVPEPVETVHSANRLIEVGAGDCDDFTVFFLAWGRFHRFHPLQIALYFRTEEERIYYHIAPVIGKIPMDVYQEFGELEGKKA
jgi:hypothetical protein